ncbi:FAD dependent oxidoreductase-domain-containing protein [Fusarium flagelliforme]|uniref:FAD dependent oxidoreductase-domain-containing protein n=1 Tax=Fusarium flagelliforme TaxID=2675880 RepID=UPI001E8CE1B7|nr:FAD dependent oxidoreductase-domain-containing protein [Fusarium flagelliforme]KAH7174693.1 FAD dependent oxidoreductase-domain-containing protein [Fusarium flagelliforme]
MSSILRSLRAQFTRSDLDLEAQTPRPSRIWVHPFKLLGQSLFRNRLLLLIGTIYMASYLMLMATAAPHERADVPGKYDVVIYGNTVAAIAAAVQTKRMKKTVAIVFPGNTLGGLTTSGLGWTDSKNGNAIGGIAREFYAKVYTHYQNSNAWKQETRSGYLGRKIGAQPGPAIDESKKVQWTFEPKAAEYILEKWMKDGKIPIFRNRAIDRSAGSVVKKNGQIASFKTLNGDIFQGKMFIDASYEGDLMEAAKISWRTGRESTGDYSESVAGFRLGAIEQLSKVDPYKKKGDPSSGLIEGVGRVIKDAASLQGKGDNFRLQSYNFRMSLTKQTTNQIPFTKPADYRESQYELLLRYFESGYSGTPFTSQLMPNVKTDSNAQSHVSTDLIGESFEDDGNYATWSYDRRRQVYLQHKSYTQGFFWTLANHPRVPKDLRTRIAEWGYAKDEWSSNNNWPYEIYIREGRRMNGIYTMRQSDIQSPPARPNNSVGKGAYSLDVHQVERVVVDGKLRDEGKVHIATPGPFNIPYQTICPKSEDATNFLNPVTMSATHIAYSAIRMEPTYMVLGQSAATAACLAIDQGVSVQDVDLPTLIARLKADKQVL